MSDSVCRPAVPAGEVCSPATPPAVMTEPTPAPVKAVPRRPRRDPLSAARIPLVMQAERMAAQLRGTPAAWPWLAEEGVDAARDAARLDALSGALSAAVAKQTNVRIAVRLPYVSAKGLLAEVALWQRRCRSWLRTAESPAELRAAARVRRAISHPAHRLAGTVRWLADGVEALEAAQGVLEPVRLAAMTAAAVALLTPLRALGGEAVAAQEARVEQTPTAKAAEAALRKVLREVRRAWKAARVGREGVFPVLNLAIAAAAVAERGVRAVAPVGDVGAGVVELVEAGGAEAHVAPVVWADGDGGEGCERVDVFVSVVG